MAVKENYRHTAKENYRKKRVAKLKHTIIGTVILFLVVPTLLCIFMMFKVIRLEDKVNTFLETYGAQYTEQQGKEMEENSNTSENSGIAHAAEIDSIQTDALSAEEKTDGEEMTCSGKDALTPEEELELNNDSKKVYLTFDDGPSSYSDELLDTLKKYNVKATFFVIGKTDEHSLEIYKRIVDEGHTLAMHSYTHKYDIIYKSLKNFKEDFEKISDLLYETTGVRPKYYRFPGGSSNTVSNVSIDKCIKFLNEEEITYFDWNAINGDATGKNYTAKQMVSNVMQNVRQNNNSVVLMHDTVSRDTTVKSLPSLIKTLEKEGYILLPINDYTKPVQHKKADSVK